VQPIEIFKIKGIPVAAIDVYRAADIVGTWAPKAKGKYVTVTGAHGVVESTNDPLIRRAHEEAALVVPDGVPLVWLGRLLGLSSIGRVNGPELMELVFSANEHRDLKHFFYGSNQTTVAKLCDALTSRFGSFNLAGVYCPPMRPFGFEESEDVLSMIRAAKPDIIWVGLSTPKQEIWLNMHMKRIGMGIGIGVGAAFDLLAGTTRRAPRWIQRSGFEWLFRLLVEPKRLYKRYFYVIPRFSFFWIEALLSRGHGIQLKPNRGL
jgi:N-acetylglucosaminyldiphosphoundecaprenol N-acetyl-beta-D-mannosaminyltransferase